MYRALPTKPIGSKSNFSIFSIPEWREANTNKPITEDHQCMKIIWVREGQADLQNGYLSTPVASGRICLLDGKASRKVHVGEVEEGFLINFDLSLLDLGDLEYTYAYSLSACQVLSMTGGVWISEEVEGNLLELAERMQKEILRERLFGKEILSRYLKLFLLYVASEANLEFGSHHKTRQQSVVERFVEKVDECFKNQKLVSEYAAMLFVTPSYLNEVVKRTTGHSAGHHIKQRIAIEAKRMALYSQTSMKEIAYHLGFSDSAHFSKFFKIVSGLNFSDFKKSQQVLAVAV